MKEALMTAGFVGVEPAEGVIHARLTAASGEFTARPLDDTGNGLWELALCWPLRATADQIAGWNATHRDVPMDIWQGETRIVMQARADANALQRWAVVAQDMIAQATRWRQAQRAPGEGY